MSARLSLRFLPHATAHAPHPPRQLYIDRCINSAKKPQERRPEQVAVVRLFQVFR